MLVAAAALALVRSVAVLAKASRVPSGLKTRSEFPGVVAGLPAESVPPGVTLTALVVPAARLRR